MAIVHDVIPPFQLFQPSSLDEALDLLDARGTEAWVMAGGMDSFDWLKDRTKRTSAVVELSQVGELHGIRESDGGFEIGAMTTLTDVAEHAGIRDRFGMLAEAAGLVASPQIRNQGTLAAMSRRTPAAGITGAAGTATAQAATSVTPTRRRR
ncbi:MAG: FAD binding domain-containing protein [Vicinamibacterales bacterium]